MTCKSIFLNLIILSQTILLNSQVSLTNPDVTYTQNFNGLSAGTDGTSFTWSNNTTLTGWYLSPTIVMTESSTSSMNNTGAPYMIVSGSDRSIGGRASGTSPNNNIYLGVRLKNNTGQTLSALDLSYYGEQWSIAENQTNVNKLAFSYQISSSAITSLTSGSWTNVTGANFTQIYTSSQSSSMGGSACSGTSAQCLALNGNASANRTLISLTIPISLAPGDEVMLRWYDVNDAANDHHLQIDEVSITPRASVILPITLSWFEGNCSESGIGFMWVSESEWDLEKYTIEYSLDGTNANNVAQLQVTDNSSKQKKYDYLLDRQNTKSGYYRLNTFDLNGNKNSFNWVYISCENHPNPQLFPNPTSGLFSLMGVKTGTSLQLYTNQGQLLQESITSEDETHFDLSKYVNGIYFLLLSGEEQTESLKITVSH